MCRGVPVVVTPADGSLIPSWRHRARRDPAHEGHHRQQSEQPLGVVLTEPWVAALVEFCEDRADPCAHGRHLPPARLRRRPAPSCFALTTRDIESTRLIVINGVAKTYGMTGFRIGWAVAGQAIVKVMGNVQSQTTSCTPSDAGSGRLRAARARRTRSEQLRLFMQRNRDVVLRGLSAIRVCQDRQTRALLLPPRFPRLLSEGRSRRLLRAGGFLLVEGAGRHGARLRLRRRGPSATELRGATEDAAEGVARIRWALDPSAPTRDSPRRLDRRPGLAVGGTLDGIDAAPGPVTEIAAGRWRRLRQRGRRVPRGLRRARLKQCHPADLVVLPGSTSEVAALAELCHAGSECPWSCGRGTGYRAGPSRFRGGVVVSLSG